MFSLKLDFIMKLTNTKANALGAACHLDSSHISRLKNGTRNLPKNPSFVDDMSKYFATHINNAYQQDAICKELNIPKLPNNQDESAKLIKNWLLDKEGSNSRGLVYDDGIEAVEDIEEARRKDNIIISKPQKYYYGPFGKREAVSKWIPVYATGMIEPYYYPRLRDGLLQRTLFIAPGCAAVVSASACMNTEGMLNEFITDPKAIDALLREYDVLFGQSKKLMDIYDQNKIAQFWDIFEECTKAENDTIMMGKMPTLVTMPEWVAQNMQKRAPGSKIYKYWKLLSDK